MRKNIDILRKEYFTLKDTNMLDVQLNQGDAIAILAPKGALSKEDFIEASNIIDPYIETSGPLNGLIIYVKAFPGWDSFSALVTHLKFVNDHHEEIVRLAFVTDSVLGKFAEHIANHFVKAEVQSFSFDKLEEAQQWILHGSVE